MATKHSLAQDAVVFFQVTDTKGDAISGLLAERQARVFQESWNSDKSGRKCRAELAKLTFAMLTREVVR